MTPRAQGHLAFRLATDSVRGASEFRLQGRRRRLALKWLCSKRQGQAAGGSWASLGGKQERAPLPSPPPRAACRRARRGTREREPEWRLLLAQTARAPARRAKPPLAACGAPPFSPAHGQADAARPPGARPRRTSSQVAADRKLSPRRRRIQVQTVLDYVPVIKGPYFFCEIKIK